MGLPTRLRAPADLGNSRNWISGQVLLVALLTQLHLPAGDGLLGSPLAILCSRLASRPFKSSAIAAQHPHQTRWPFVERLASCDWSLRPSSPTAHAMSTQRFIPTLHSN